MSNRRTLWQSECGRGLRTPRQPVIIDEAFLTGIEERRRWEGVLGNLAVLWVGVHCDVAVAAQREQQRPDRVSGMAEHQAAAVHVGMLRCRGGHHPPVRLRLRALHRAAHRDRHHKPCGKRGNAGGLHKVSVIHKIFDNFQFTHKI